MGLFNVIQAYRAYKYDKKKFTKTMDRSIIDLHIRTDFTDFPKILSNYYTKKRKFVIITGRGATHEFGKNVAKELRKNNYTISFKSVKIKTPSLELAQKLAEDFKNHIPIGVGGGSILDLAKLMGEEIGNKSISVPTTLSTDAIASPIAVCMDNGKRRSIRVLRPSPIYANLEVIKKVPRLNISGIGEALSNYTSIRDWRNSAYKFGKNKVGYSKWSALLATITYGYWLRKEILKEGKLTNDIIDLLIGSHFFSGILMELAGNSAPCSGAEHLLSHALDELYPNKKSLHGEQVGMFSIVVACLQNKWFRKFGICSRDAFQIRRTLDILNAPIDFDDLGLKTLKEEDIERIFSLAKKMGDDKKRYTILDHINFTEFKLALNKTGVWLS